MTASRRVARTSWQRLGLAVVLVVSATLAAAQSQQLSANELMRRTVANELKAAGVPGHYMYRLRTETSGRSKTKTMIQTKDWLIGRLVAVDDKPLSPGRSREEDQRLDRIVKDPKRLSDEQRKQREYEKRVWDILKSFPEAFLYEYAETAQGADGDKLVRLAFRPNPAFQPRSRALTALRGAKGSVWIDSTAQRVKGVDATLFRPVDFGWGILGRLNEGGSFGIEEVKTESGTWTLKAVSLHFTGKMFLVKSLKVDSMMTMSDFRSMPENLTLAEGLKALRNQDKTMTQTAKSQ